MLLSCLILAAVSLGLTRNAPMSTDCFVASGGGIPSVVARAELVQTSTSLVVTIWRRLNEGERPCARGQANPPESMFEQGGDTVEMALAPHAQDPSVYYHFIANPSNVLYQAKGRDATWRPRVPVSVQSFCTKDRWSVAFTVPYAAFGLAAPAEGDVWRANFATRGCDWSGLSDYHDSVNFGRIVFGRASPRTTVESVRRDKDGTLHVEFAIPPERSSEEIPHKGRGIGYDLTLSSGGRKLAGYQVEVPGEDSGYLTLDGYYYPARENLKIAYSAREVGNCTVRIRRLDGFAGDEVFMNREPSGTICLDPLMPGDYAFEVDDGSSRAACQFEVTDAVWKESGYPRYFVVGSEKVASSNCVFKSAFVCQLTRKPKTGWVYNPRRPLYGAVQQLDGEASDGVLYRLGYEAQMAVFLRTDDPNRLEEVEDRAGFYRDAYRAVKRCFPDCRLSIHVDRAEEAADFASACDVLEYADWRSSYAHDVLPRLRACVETAQTAADGRPVVFWLGVAVPGNGKWRTADELNSAIRYCAVKGIMGNVLHLGHGGVPQENKRLWSFVRGCERAVGGWYGDWANGTAVPTAPVDPDVVCELRVGKGHAVLVAVNFSRFERTAGYTDPLTKEARTVRLPGCGSMVRKWEIEQE